MKKRLLVLSITIVFAVSLLMLRCTEGPVAGNGSQTPNSGIIGKLYNPDGTPAANAKVYAVPSDHNPISHYNNRTSSGIIDSTLTNNKGEYSFDSLTKGYYNLLGYKDNLSSFNDSIYIPGTTDETNAPPDTLKGPGSLHGVIKLQPGDNANTVFILIFGTYTWTAPSDSIGNFDINNLAEGVYHVKFLTTLADYGPLDVNLTIRAGMNDTMNDTLIMPFAGIPVPQGLKLSYDTMMQIVTLRWNRCDSSLVKGYNVYRRNVDSNTVFVSINTNLIKDTVYRDSSGVQYMTYEYKVAAISPNNMEGTKSLVVSVHKVSVFQMTDSLFIGYGNGGSNIIYDGASLIVDRTSDKITIIDTSLKQLSSFDLPTDFGNGVGHEIDNKNRIWASNYNTGRINIYSMYGIILDSVIDSNLKYPSVLRKSQDGKIFINSVDSAYVEHIRIYNDSGRFLYLFPNDSSPVTFSKITDMFFNITGDLMVLNHADSSISQYNPAGVLIIKRRLSSLTVEIDQFSNGYYIIKQNGNRGIINVLNVNFGLFSIFGVGLGIDYRDFGTIAIDSFDRMFVRRGNSIILYIKLK